MLVSEQIWHPQARTNLLMFNPSNLSLHTLFSHPNKFRAPTILDEAAETQSAKSGEGLVVPEHAEYSSDLQNGISLMKKRG